MTNVFFTPTGNWGAEVVMSNPTEEQVEALMMLGTAPHSHLHTNH